MNRNLRRKLYQQHYLSNRFTGSKIAQRVEREYQVRCRVLELGLRVRVRIRVRARVGIRVRVRVRVASSAPRLPRGWSASTRLVLSGKYQVSTR